ncbi:hypothetical protein CDAR_398261 [Caerostris darwini]|uniref:Uncharacterized protein n=1 Tax=Caerostris darwini TaxID=1538125 RepID=A0AAV4WTV2_9ARAC|nr:hypothetical protein CDAR_398261 [Caerostris darwini]
MAGGFGEGASAYLEMVFSVHMIGSCVDGPTPTRVHQVGGGGSDEGGRSGATGRGILGVRITPRARQGRTVMTPTGPVREGLVRRPLVLSIAIVRRPGKNKRAFR